MSYLPELIVMLTRNDLTVKNADCLFESCKATKAKYWGFKEKPLPLPEMKALFAKMKQCGKTTVLEVVEYDEEKCLAGAAMAAACGVDILMGTQYFDSVHGFCQAHQLKYMPFVGTITGRPSVLQGDIGDMIAYANRLFAKGVDGFDLLGYRYQGDAVLLNKRFAAETPAPVCIAGSINSYQRLDEIKEAAPWAFTIGSAFFEQKFGKTFPEQIDNVCSHLTKNHSHL